MSTLHALGTATPSVRKQAKLDRDGPPEPLASMFGPGLGERIGF
jgi:hypothetical protein